VVDKMERSDAALTKILVIVKQWDRRDVWESDLDWQKLRNIRERLDNTGGKRLWADNPPWNE
jgi:hypothetical protein